MLTTLLPDAITLSTQNHIRLMFTHHFHLHIRIVIFLLNLTHPFDASVLSPPLWDIRPPPHTLPLTHPTTHPPFQSHILPTSSAATQQDITRVHRPLKTAARHISSPSRNEESRLM